MVRHGKKRIRFGSKDKKIEDFVDPNKDPRSYIKRYILEEKYRDWFERNYPDNTIYNAVGLNEWDYNEIKKKLSPDQTGDDVKTEPEPEPEFADVPLAPSSDTPDVIVLFIITCFIAKGMKINFPKSDRKKLVTTGMGSYIFLYLFAWIMTYTLLNLPKEDFSLPFT